MRQQELRAIDNPAALFLCRRFF